MKIHKKTLEFAPISIVIENEFEANVIAALFGKVSGYGRTRTLIDDIFLGVTKEMNTQGCKVDFSVFEKPNVIINQEYS